MICSGKRGKRQRFFGEPYGFFINLCQTLFAANMAEIGLATWKGEVLSAILLIYWGTPYPTPQSPHPTSRATYLYGGRSPHHPQVMASYGLHWAAMQRAKARGYHSYDFYGYTRDPNHGYAKFSQFKRQFGGTPVTTIGAHDYFFYDRLADTLVGIFKRIKNESRGQGAEGRREEFGR
ncbi:peptidoglycan bridge formation glycyltransferase FemA/FemB family protein [Kovacikia minuta CCNUW1]|uniref:lipid II:glycine glycyltransferase FemX n=1 Tax=Kovacikia minuta TaxID=2931930 RepID=UPI001CCBABA1|nr:peptidoglycan bridge formation glycyltransferase FemA/FemB family protein [Kovacikia minuta]UBF25203.1 peptidoglycan bridge formation glycyltransferase FemA/FemB family protein [Kovacikia minuta CCNUW1]